MFNMVLNTSLAFAEWLEQRTLYRGLLSFVCLKPTFGLITSVTAWHQGKKHLHINVLTTMWLYRCKIPKQLAVSRNRFNAERSSGWKFWIWKNGGFCLSKLNSKRFYSWNQYKIRHDNTKFGNLCEVIESGDKTPLFVVSQLENALLTIFVKKVVTIQERLAN